MPKKTPSDELAEELAGFIGDGRNKLLRYLFNPFKNREWKREVQVGLFLRLMFHWFGPAYPRFLWKMWGFIRAKRGLACPSYEQFRNVIHRLKRLGLIEVAFESCAGGQRGPYMTRSYYRAAEDIGRNSRGVFYRKYHFGWVNPQFAYGKRFEFVPIDAPGGRGGNRRERRVKEYSDVEKSQFLRAKHDEWRLLDSQFTEVLARMMRSDPEERRLWENAQAAIDRKIAEYRRRMAELYAGECPGHAGPAPTTPKARKRTGKTKKVLNPSKNL